MVEVAWLPDAQQRIMGISLLLRFREHRGAGWWWWKECKSPGEGVGCCQALPLLCLTQCHLRTGMELVSGEEPQVARPVITVELWLFQKEGGGVTRSLPEIPAVSPSPSCQCSLEMLDCTGSGRPVGSGTSVTLPWDGVGPRGVAAVLGPPTFLVSDLSPLLCKRTQ